MKIIPNTRLLWGTQTLMPNTEVELDDAAAKHLIAEGVAVKVKGGKAKAETAAEAEAPAAETPETPATEGDAPAGEA